MNPRCAAAITQAGLNLGRKIAKEELRGIEDYIRNETKLAKAEMRQAGKVFSESELMTEVAARVTEKIKHDAAKKSQREQLQVIKSAENDAYLKAQKDSGVAATMGLLHRIGFIADGKGGGISVETRGKALAHMYLEEGLRPLFEIENRGALGFLLGDKEASFLVAKELHGQSTGNAEAKFAADTIRNTVDRVLKEHGDKGGDVARLKNWVPQVQDQWRVYKGGEKWKRDALEHVDRSTLIDDNGLPMDDARAAAFISESFDSISTDGLFKDRKNLGSASIANRHRAHRQLHWKSPESWKYMMDNYGAGSLYDQLGTHIKTMSDEIALMEVFGPNALHEVERMISVAKELDRGTIDSKKIDSNVKRFNAMVEMQSGIADGITGSVWIHRLFQNIKNINIANKLGSVPIAQMADNATAVATVRALNYSIPDWMAFKLKGYTGDIPAFARSSGVAHDLLLQNISRLTDDASSTSVTSKLAQMTMQISGAQKLTAMHRNAFSAFVLNQTAEMSRKYTWDTLPEGDRARLEAKGFNKSNWDIIRAAEYDPTGTGIGMREIQAVPLDTVKQLIPDQIQGVLDQGAELQQRMEGQNLKEQGWLQGRQQKFAEYKQKIQQMIDDYTATREKRVQDYSEMNLKRGGEMMARVDQAEIDLEIAQKSVEALNEKRSDKFAEELKRGIENYGRRRSEIGETLGAKRHSAKLQSAAADRAYEKLSEQLIAKKNELFGPERTEDGFVVIGRLTKAVKELDAYTAKMEQRIANATKKDGTTKKGKEGTIERAEKLTEDAKIEFEAISQMVEKQMSDLKEKVSGSQMELRSLFDAIQAKKARAEVEADIASYLATEKSEAKIQAMIDTLKFRSNQGVERMMSEGERLGYKKAMAEARVKAMAKREADYAKTADKEVFSKAAEFEKRVDKRMTELNEFTKSVTERMDKRDAIVQEWNDKIGSRIDAVANQALHDTIMKLNGFAIEEAEMAVLQPSLYTKTGPFQVRGKGHFDSELAGAVFQFKTFPLAFWLQHLQQRAQMNGNPTMYRISLFAMSSLIGGVVTLLSDLASGKDPREIYDKDKPEVALKFGLQAAVRGGGASFVGDMFNAAYESRDPTEMMSGPIFGNVKRTFGVTREALKGSEGNVAKASLDFARDVMPFNNLIWTRAVWNNFLVSELNELASPGYQRRMRGIAQKNYDAGYFMGMGQETRAPNFDIVNRQ